MLNNLKARLAVVVLLLVAFALTGCFGPKSFTVTVKIDPALEGVEIRGRFLDRSAPENDQCRGTGGNQGREGTVLVP